MAIIEHDRPETPISDEACLLHLPADPQITTQDIEQKQKSQTEEALRKKGESLEQIELLQRCWDASFKNRPG
jgi:hypothetical protein